MAIGKLPGVQEGSIWPDKKKMHEIGLHKNIWGGIVGKADVGAESIALSGGYIDDEDYGNELIYTGSGGRDDKTGRQVADQEFSRQNKSLVTSCNNGTPVRVIRGSNHKSNYSPSVGYRYDGLFSVESYWKEKGVDGFKICRYRLTKIEANNTTEVESDSPDGNSSTSSSKETRRSEITVQRIVRDTKLGREIKALYDYKCQICGAKLDLKEGAYAEAAHIKPLGRPHNGPDTKDNLLCLCPNDHVLFHRRAIYINADLTVFPSGKKLQVHKKHLLSEENLRYHREMSKL